MPNEFEGLLPGMQEPDYLRAASNHALAAGQPMGFDEAITKGITTGTGIGAGAVIGSAFGPLGTLAGAAIGGLTGYDWRATAAATVSGANQLYNSAINLANILPGAEAQEADINNWMAALDDDLPSYYMQHKDGLDTLGFIASSIPAGLGAIKIYNYGAKALEMTAGAGMLGTNTAEATGLLIPTQAKYYQAATQAAAKSQNAFKLLEGNYIAATLAGAGEQAIQGVVFEAGVQAALNASPLLENQDLSDLGHNLFTGAWVSGLVGGIGGAIGMASSIGRKLGDIDKALRPYEFQEGSVVGSKPFEEIALSFENQAKLSTELPDDPLLVDLAKQKQARTNVSIDTDRRAKFGELVVGDDSVVRNQFHEFTNSIWLQSGQDTESVRRYLDGLVAIGRKSNESKAEKAYSEVRKAIDKWDTIKQGPVPDELLRALDSKEVSKTYITMWGERAGAIDLAPKAYTDLWSFLETGDSVKITANSVQAGKKVYKIDPYKAKSVLDIEPAEANARYLWAMKHEMPLKAGMTIDQFDIPMLEKAYKDIQAGLLNSIKVGDQVLTTDTDVAYQLIASKNAVAKQLLAEGKLPIDAIADLVNVKASALTGTKVNVTSEKNLFALQDAEKSWQEAHKDMILDKQVASPLFKPNQLKAVYDTSLIPKEAGLAQPFIANIKARQKVYEQAAKRVAAQALGSDIIKDMVDFTPESIYKATRSGAGATAFKPASGELGSAASVAERAGQVHNRARMNLENYAEQTLNPSLHKLFGDQAAVMDIVTTFTKLRGTGERYILSSEKQALVHKDYAKFIAGDLDKMPELPPSVELEIPIKSEKAWNVLKEHVKLNDQNLAKMNPLRTLNSGTKLIEPGTVYAPPPDLSQFKYHAFVTDNHMVTGQQQVRMLWATSAEELEKKLSLIPEEFQAGIVRKPKAVTGPEVEKYYKAVDAYNRDDALTDNYFDGVLERSGVSAEYMPIVKDQLVVDNLLKWHKQQQRNIVDAAFGAYYSKEFDEFKKLAERWSNVSLSKLGKHKPGEMVKEQAGNPYLSYIRTALNMSNTESIPGRIYQNFLDEQVSKVWNTAKRSLDHATKPEDLDIINKAFQEAGINTVNYDAMNIALANQEFPRGALSTLTRRVNAIIAGIGLSPDVLNAINNRVGSMVFLAPETNHLINDILKGNEATVGALKDLAHITIPGSKHELLAPGKLIANAIKMSFQEENQLWAKSKGFSIRHMQDVVDIIDTIALRPEGYKASYLEKLDMGFHKLMRFTNKAAELTGNAHAEEFTRLTSALVMKQLTDTAIQAGLLSERVADSYIQTFVNRTNGVYLASQRPMMFSGPVGQAMGLYQTYQITMLNNFFRYMNNGNQKSAALMMAAQGSIYGLSGLPSFQAINTHIVGGFAGNQDNTDIYSVAARSMPKEGFDWLMYGGLSNALGLIHPDLKMNMYTRGDVNPRNLSVVPLNPMDFASVQLSAKFFSNWIDTMQKIAGGGDVYTSLIQGLEHNALSRPLGGIAQIMESLGPTGKVYSTTASGSLVSANDLMHLNSLVRLAGARPLDDALALDRDYRSIVFKAKDAKLREELGSTIKTKLMGGQELSEDDLHSFQEEYVKIGGKQAGFNKFMHNLMQQATYSQANRISQLLKTRDSIEMQYLMGGYKDNNLMPEQEAEVIE